MRTLPTSFGDVAVSLTPAADGWTARLADPGERLAHVLAAHGASEEEALERLREGVERFGSRPAGPPAPPPPVRLR